MLRRVDYTSPQGVLLVSLVGFVARLPNALSGIGFDGDSGLFLRNALLSKEYGGYVPSRGPGYFVPDLIAQALAGYGPVPLCLLNSTIFVISIPVFASILRLLGVPHRNWLIWAYALSPVGWLATSDVMVEYSLCLLGVLLGWLFTLRGNFWGAGLALGAGAAMRPSQGVFVLIVFIVYWILSWGIRRGIGAAVLSLVPLTLLWVLPVGTLAGWHVVTSYIPYEAPISLQIMRAGGRLLSAYGFLGVASVFVSTVLSLRALLLRYRYINPAWLSFSAFVVLSVLFLRHPIKLNYLFITIPFMLCSISIHSLRVPIIVACSSIILHCFIGFLSVGLISTRHDFRWFGWGAALRDRIERHEVAKQIQQLIDRVPPAAVLGAQDYMVRKLEYEALRGTRAGFRFTGKFVVDTATQRVFALATSPKYANRIVQELGQRKRYITSGADFLLKRDFGYDASLHGFIVLQVDNVGL